MQLSRHTIGKMERKISIGDKIFRLINDNLTGNCVYYIKGSLYCFIRAVSAFNARDIDAKLPSKWKKAALCTVGF